ncbi:hypothetical protein DEO72_LG10g1513 [Vigna unguiculata]|uniref:Uncharacterized protein n=1 Tax=Vigna unguiculata TaxID=3917 RepID=A0A4D6NDQ7_VIGUN|nr:hypothetical protein DEO72_LG5g1202 [Vigna unguiculata]QCE10285.1 hypothetical protein DEO72_LG10g1513 [Vigna unguiculata]
MLNNGSHKAKREFSLDSPRSILSFSNSHVAVTFRVVVAALFVASFAAPIVVLFEHRSCILSFSNNHTTFSFHVAVTTLFASSFIAPIVASFAHRSHAVRTPFPFRQVFPLLFT